MNNRFHVIVIDFSDFGLVRGLYLAKAMSFLGLNTLIITNDSVYVPEKYLSEMMSCHEVKIIRLRLPLVKALYTLIFGRLIVYTIFAFAVFIYLLKINPGVLYLCGPHPFVDISCLFYKLLRNKVITVSDVTDLWPDTLKYVNLNKTLKAVLTVVGHIINHKVYSKVNAIVTHNDAIAKILTNRFRRKIHVIHGVIDLQAFRPISKDEALSLLPKSLSDSFSNLVKKRFVILYAGIMGVFQDPTIIVDIAKGFVEDRDILFLVIGTGSLKCELLKKIHSEVLHNVFVFDPMRHELMPFIYNLADVALILPPAMSVPGIYEYFIVTLPRKFIEYSACGKPILCLTPPCVASRLCLQWKAGYHISPRNIKMIQEVIRTLKKDETLRVQIGKNARRMAESLFSIQVSVETLKRILGLSKGYAFTR